MDPTADQGQDAAATRERAPVPFARLPFTFRLSRGLGSLHLRDRRLLPWVHVEELELALPELPLPLDVSAGPDLFQSRRCRVRRAVLRLDRAGIDELIARARPALARLGVGAVQITTGPGGLTLTASVQTADEHCELSARLHALPWRRSLRLVMAQPCSYGLSTRPAPLLLHQILCLLCATGDAQHGGDTARVLGLGDIEIAALHSLLWNLFPAAGWRLPDSRELVLVEVAHTVDGLQVRYGSDAVPPPFAPELNALLDGAGRLRPADERLLAGDLAGARRGYREAMLASPDSELAWSRFLSVAITRPQWFPDALEIAAAALARWPDLAAARGAIAAVAASRGDLPEAARRLTALADASGDPTVRLCATVGAARLLEECDPVAALALHERVLADHPHHEEAVAAVSAAYARSGRWADLVALRRARRGPEAPPDWRDRLAVAQILEERLGDPDAARDELEAACTEHPEVAEAHEVLARLELSLGQKFRAVAALDRLALVHAASGDDAGEAEVQLRIARIWEGEPDPRLAAERYLRAVELVPDHVEALRGAARATDRTGKTGRAMELWEQLLRVLPGPAAAEDLCDCARCLLQAGQLARAEELLHAAAATPGPVRGRALGLLAELCERRGDEPGACAALAEAASALELAAAAAEPAARAELLASAAELTASRARLLEASGGDPTPDWRRICALAPASRRANEAARSLLAAARASGDSAEILACSELLLDLDPPPTERVALLAGSARLRAGHPAGRERALAEIDQALAICAAEQRRELLQSKAEILALAGQPREQAATLLAGAAVDDDARRALSAQLAAADALLAAGDAEAARGAAAAARARLGALEEVSRVEEAAVLARLGEATWRCRQFGELIAIYERLATLAAERPLPPPVPRLVQLLHRLGAAYEAEGWLEAAASTLERASHCDDLAEQPLVLRTLAEIQERLGQLERAAETRARCAGNPRYDLSAAARADLWYRAADCYARLPGHAGDAERCLGAALELSQQHLPALDALEALYRGQNDQRRLADLLERKLSATSAQPQAQKALLLRLAALQERDGRSDVARATYERVLLLDPGARPALRFIAGHAERNGELFRAGRALALLAGELPGDGELPGAQLSTERGEAVFALASLAVTHPERSDLHRLASASLERRPPAGSADEQWQRAALLLSRSPTTRPAELDPGRLRELADQALARRDAREATRRLQQLAEVTTPALPDAAGDPAGEVYLHLADLYFHQLHQAVPAHRALRRAAECFAPGPRRQHALRLLATAAVAADAHADAVWAYEQLGGDALPAAERLALARSHRGLGGHERAGALLRALLDEPPVRREAEALLHLVNDEAQSAEMSAAAAPHAEAAAPHARNTAPERDGEQQALEQQALEQQALEQRALEQRIVEQSLRLGADLERRGELDAAIAHYERAAVIPGDSRALEALERTCRAAGDIAALIELLGRLIAASGDARTRSRLWHRRARLHREQRQEAELYRCLKEANACDPDDPDIAIALRAVAMARGEWPLTATLLTAELGRAAQRGERSEVAALHFELGLVCDEKLLDGEAALTHYERALELDPEIPAAPAPLARLYQLAGRLADAARLFERAASCARGDADRLALLERAAGAAEQAGDQEEARRLRALGASLEAQLSGAGWRDEPPGHHAGADPVSAGSHTAPGGNTAADDLAWHDGRGRSERAAERDRAIAEHEQILAHTPHAPRSLAALTELYAERGDHERAAATLQLLIRVTDDIEPRADLLYRLGEIYAFELDQPDEAADAYLKGIDLNPHHAPILRRLVDHYWRSDDWAAVMEVARELHSRKELFTHATGVISLAHVVVAAGLTGNLDLGGQALDWLGHARHQALATALVETLKQSGKARAQDLGRAAVSLARTTGELDIAELAVLLRGQVVDSNPARALLAALEQELS
jgi:tetratricopeptide (TPR) repeat protein